MARVCKKCEKVLIDDRGDILNYPNKMVAENGAVTWLCNDCKAAVKVVEKPEDAPEEKKEEVKEEPEKPEKKKAGKKGGKKK